MLKEESPSPGGRSPSNFLALIGKRIAEAFMAHFLDLPESEKAHYAEIMKAYIDTAKSFTQLR
jgi:hypothetical protein